MIGGRNIDYVQRTCTICILVYIIHIVLDTGIVLNIGILSYNGIVLYNDIVLFRYIDFYTDCFVY